MECSIEYKAHAAAITALFTATFTASEGAEEGALIGELACRLMTETPLQDLRVFTAWNGSELDGAIIFSRLIFEGDNRAVFILGPVAVAPDRQGQNIGRRLIAHGLEALRTEGVDLTVTYGDPNFYQRVSFSAITEEDVPAPFPLQYPEGWLGQSLDDMPLSPLNGPSRCVPAFNDPVFW